MVLLKNVSLFQRLEVWQAITIVTLCMFKIYIIGYENHIQPVDDMDIAFCKPYTKGKATACAT